MRDITVLVLATLCVVASAPCFGHTLSVDCGGGGDYLTVQAAVDAASEGDTIHIAACLYEERVVIPDIALTLEGDGAGSTEIAWSGSDATVEFQESALAVRSLAVRSTASGLRRAISWDEGALTLEDCRVSGQVAGGYYHGRVFIKRSTVEQLNVCGGMTTSTIEMSRFGSASFGEPWQAYHGLQSSDSFYGTLVAGHSQCHGDSIGYIELWGGPDAYHDMEATACTIDECVADYSPMVDWDGCLIGTLTYRADSWEWPLLQMQDCLVTGDLDVVSVYGRPGGASPSSARQEGYTIEHNTVLGGLTFEYDGYFDPPEQRIRSNIIMGSSVVTTGDALLITHNDFAGGVQLSAPSAEVSDNLEADPLFCEESAGDYTVHKDSPCVDVAHDGSVIGAFPVGCEVPVERASWGAIKARYN